MTPSQDAYTSGLRAQQNKNYGSAPYLYLGQGSGNIVYIKFDLSTIPSGYTGSNISKATLKLYVPAVADVTDWN